MQEHGYKVETGFSQVLQDRSLSKSAFALLTKINYF
jgi:hypothetical protein